MGGGKNLARDSRTIIYACNFATTRLKTLRSQYLCIIQYLNTQYVYIERRGSAAAERVASRILILVKTINRIVRLPYPIIIPNDGWTKRLQRGIFGTNIFQMSRGNYFPGNDKPLIKNYFILLYSTQYIILCLYSKCKNKKIKIQH